MDDTAAPTPETDAIARGQALFESNCVYCHEPDATGFKTPLDALSKGYAESGGRAHGRQLESSQWAELVEYLEREKR